MTVSFGRDNAYGFSRSFEYVVFDGDKVFARKGGFKSIAAAKRAVAKDMSA